MENEKGAGVQLDDLAAVLEPLSLDSMERILSNGESCGMAYTEQVMVDRNAAIIGT